MTVSHERRHVAYWLAAFFVFNAVYFIAIFRSFDRIRSCCDAVWYFVGATKVVEDGLFADVHLLGYRSIWNYANVALISFLGDLVGVHTPDELVSDIPLMPSYAAGSLLLFAFIGSGAVVLFHRYDGFPIAFAATFLNPLTLANIPVPVQESQMALVLVPLSLAAFLLVRNGVHGAAVVTLSALAAASWMIKSSFILVALPLAVFVLYYAWRNRSHLARSTLALSAALVALILGPQVIVSFFKFGSLYPYPVAGVLFDQFSYGHRMWKWETIIFEPGTARMPQGRAFLSPFGDIAPEAYLGSLLADPLKALALIGGHLLAAFDHTFLKVYIDRPKLPPFSLNNVLVGFVLFTGLSQLLRSLLRRSYRLEFAHLDILFFGIVAVFPVLAVETRFSFLPMIAMTFRSLALFVDPASRSDRTYNAVMGVLAGFLFASAIAVLYGTAEAL